jgi:4-amino-4-deoxy-L-arabinose transferase-like glycosyltransferase
MTTMVDRIAAPRSRTRGRGRDLARRATARPELLALLALAAVLDLWALGQNGWANDYYSAAVRSMSTSWHDFLYASFDPSGVMTVDKPPLALWVQALSARVFGFHPLSLLVPQALMGVAAVGLAYDLTRRHWGRVAGFVAGLVLATTPVAVAIFRHDNPDALLVLCCTAALWCAARAFEDGRTRWLVAAGVCVGLGFETKMAAALLVVPALAVAWLWVAPRGRAAAVRSLLAGGAALVAVGGAWPLLVALTPASSRPWISGTADNSIWSLIFGYNGLGRLDGQAGGPGGTAGPGGAGGPGGGVFGGSTGPLRLFESSLGGQAGWLVGAALVGVAGLAVATRLRRSDARTGWVLAAGGSFLTIAVAFSAARGIFHPYYTSELAPFTAVLVGATAGRSLARDRLARVLLPAAIAGGILSELLVIRYEPAELAWLRPVLVAGGIAVIAVLVAAPAARRHAVTLALALALLLAGPADWAFATLGHATSGTFPAGGPATASFAGGAPGGAARGFGGAGSGGATRGFAGGGPAGGGMFGGDGQAVEAAVRYARSHGGGTVAIASQSGAAQAIIASGDDVAGIGGFSGRESDVSAAWLAQAVRSGRIRWVLADSGSGGPNADGRVGATKAIAAVEQTCRRATTVDGTALYDCAGRASAIAAAG